MKQHAYIKALSTYLPKTIVANDDRDRLTRKTGISRRHVVKDDECASDLAVQAAECLFEQANVKRELVDFVIFCTQSPDYFLPTTACLLQDRLGIGTRCGSFDFNLGCSGYVYGLSIAKGLIETGQARNTLLLTSETYTKYIDKDDTATAPLFGDGASATLISAVNDDREGLYGFDFGTDGSGANSLIVRDGASRYPFRRNGAAVADDNDRGAYLYMNGIEITQFALKVVPTTLRNILTKTSLSKEEIDYYVFHQANKFMLNFLQEQCGLMDMPYWNNVREYGNTVSTSIPLALRDLARSRESTGCSDLKKVMLMGFGVGLSWGGCIVDMSLCKF